MSIDRIKEDIVMYKVTANNLLSDNPTELDIFMANLYISIYEHRINEFKGTNL